MAKVKQELRSKNFIELEAYAQNHQTDMNENPNFTEPVPNSTDYEAILLTYSASLAAHTLAEQQLATALVERNEAYEAMLTAVRERGVYVQTASGGSAVKILSSGFQIQAVRTPTSSMPAPTIPVAKMGAYAGQIDLSCAPVPKARSYITEMAVFTDGEAPLSWSSILISSRCTNSVTGLVSGTKYAFRFVAVGPNGLKSPYSGIAVCMAP